MRSKIKKKIMINNKKPREQLAEYISACAFETLDLPVEQEGVQIFAVCSPHHFSNP
jgi:hypothetical protein